MRLGGVRLESKDVVASGESKVIEKFVNFTYKHPPKPLTPNITGLPAGQEFFTNIPTHDQVWCLISVGQFADDCITQIAIMKYDTWRDAFSSTVAP